MSYDQPSTTKKQSSNGLGIVLLAAAVGTVAGLLFAPKRGTETREELKNKYNGVKNKTQDGAMDAKDRLNRGVEAARSKVHLAADKSKDIADKAADKTHESTDVKHSANATTLADEIKAEHEKRGRRGA